VPITSGSPLTADIEQVSWAVEKSHERTSANFPKADALSIAGAWVWLCQRDIAPRQLVSRLRADAFNLAGRRVAR